MMGMLFTGNNDMTSGGSYSRTMSNHTVMYWLRCDSDATVRRPFGNTGLWEARTTGSGGGTATLISDYLQSGILGHVILTIGTMHHVAFVQNVSGSQRLAYLDGVLVNIVNNAFFSGTQNGLVRIGTSPGNINQEWFGVIDDIRVYDRVVPADEIQTIHACRGRDCIMDSLALWYPMNEGAVGTIPGTAVERVQGGGLNATVSGGSPVYNYDAGLTYRRAEL